MKKACRLACVYILCVSICGCSVQKKQQAPAPTGETTMEQAQTTPFGRYPETVTYTLGKMTGLNNSNMPEGDTYENNAYTRYLKKKLNIQNKDVFEAAESENFAEMVSMTVASKDLPDVMLVNDIQTLQTLVENDMVEDLTQVYETCTTDRIKKIYQSYGDSIFDAVTFDGKLMALPETNIDNGPSLLWLRKDWMDKLGLDAPKTLADAEKIVQAFVTQDPGGNGKGKTIGLVCDEELAGESDYSQEYQMDIVFASYQVYPKRWVYNQNGQIEYGSVQPAARKALRRLRQMYQSGVLDQEFLLRGSNNIIDAVVSGQCGSFFGPWWAPNNPLMEAVQNDPDAVWTPYLLETDEDGSTSFARQNPTTKYVVVRKGYRHPEIVMKIVSVLFDEIKYDRETLEMAQYYQKNVDPTARPLAINVDFYDALTRCYQDLKVALTGKKEIDDLDILERSYYESTYRYQRTRKAQDGEDWAAYTSRITACSILDEGKIKTVDTAFFLETPTMKKKWWKLQSMEKEAYLEIVTGQKPLSYFDTFVRRWKKEGGDKITAEVEKPG